MKKPDISLTEDEIQRLNTLFGVDGAWTWREVTSHFSSTRVKELTESGILNLIYTEIGPLFLLAKDGHHAIYGTLQYSNSIEIQLNWTYQRLVLQKLGWRSPTDLERLGLEDHDRSKQLIEVITPDGHALFDAKMTGSGFSRRHIGRIVERFKSLALFHDFKVILAVPNAGRGRRLAERHAAFLEILEVRPETGAPPELNRLHSPTAPKNPPSEGPHLAGEAWKTDPRYTQLPAYILSLLQQNRTTRIEAAMKSIETDGVMSVALLKRFYALEAADLPETYWIRTVIRTSPRQTTSETRIEFLTLSRRLARYADSRLAHRAGTGCMRHLLDIPSDSERYKAEHQGLIKAESPDALWIDDTGAEIALEYDNGTYSHDTIETKLTTFGHRGYKTVWGVSHVRRQQRLTTLFGQQMHGEILLVEWWK